jgi:alpha-glucosidase
VTDSNLWWQTGIIYQIFPLSFMDSNGDGLGDLPGIVSRLDYIAMLGVDAIWLSPIYPSPMADFGYDVSDHMDIHSTFGTMADFDHLLAEAHRRGLRLILDLVPNHTSDQHPWFVDSRSSRDDPRRDWFIWRDPAPGGGPPNNWVSYFGSAWTFDDGTGQYYFHQFREEQPELNYRNPDVLQALLEVMRFWLDKGVDGFRVDVIALLAKDERFLDEPSNPDYRADQLVYHSLLHIYTEDQPAVHDYVRAMRGVLDAYDERVMIGELDPIGGLMSYYGADLDECHLPFNFNLLEISWEAKVVREIADAYDAALPPEAWPTWVLGNHDRRRIASRAPQGQARVAQMLLLTLRGTPTCYYGDEIGMVDAEIPPDRLRDTTGYDHPSDALRFSRDPQHTPMQWDASRNAGFSLGDAEPWLPVGADAAHVNVALQDRDPRSMLTLFRHLSALRREHSPLSVGSYRSLDPGNERVFAYERRAGSSRLIVALNFTGAPQAAELGSEGGEVLLSTELDRAGPERLSPFRLRANEGVVVRIVGR